MTKLSGDVPYRAFSSCTYDILRYELLKKFFYYFLGKEF